MKEKIYTIAITEAFGEQSECPLCVLEKKLENEYIDYFLGPSLMEPECRSETNEKGFCRKHFELLYNRRENRLGLGLIIDTHLCEQNGIMKKMYEDKAGSIKKDSEISLLKNISNKVSSKQTETDKFINDLITMLSDLESKCSICHKLDYTMDRYIDVILYLWFKEDEFRDRFNSKKGLCLKHLRQLLEGVKKYLSTRDAAVFVDSLLKLQIENMERLRQEVSWFTKKFDYRNNDAPWGSSRDALQRSIQKIVGYCNLK